MTLLRGQYRKRLRWAVWGGAMVAVVAVAAPAVAGTFQDTGGSTAIADSYVVELRDAAVSASAVDSASRGLATKYGAQMGRVYRHALRGFEARVPAAAARRLAADPAVRSVTPNHEVGIASQQAPVPSWGLDRIDQRALPLSGSYTYPNTAPTVRAYVLDSGIRYSHNDFGGRAISGFDAIDGGSADDCHGHGTHVAGTVGGTSYGVAKRVTLVGVRVLGCGGRGSLSTILAGIDWMVGDHDPGEPAVANMSIVGQADTVENNAVAAAIADGITVVVAAGNDGDDACDASPASAPEAITVGSTTEADARSGSSNIGTCLDIFAPGNSITSAGRTDDNAAVVLSGTSMASPHVAGAAALVLLANPSFTPQRVRDALVTSATTGVVTDPGEGSPNRLLFVVQGGPDGDDFSVAVSPPSATRTAGGSVMATLRTGTNSGPAQSVTLSASGLPSGASVSFAPASLSTGGSAQMRIATSLSTPGGTYRVAVTAASSRAVRTFPFMLTVTPPSGCSATNGTDIDIPDDGSVQSAITVAGCAGKAAIESAVEMHITHWARRDLSATLLAPDGSRYPLHERADGGGADLDRTFLVDLSDEVAAGTWKLVVDDAVPRNVGLIDSWSLRLKSTTTPGCTGANDADVPIDFDTGSGESPITIATCTAAPSSTSLVDVHVVHPVANDLVVSLVAPDGSVYVLHDQTDVTEENIDVMYTVDLSAETGNGAWRLQVEDVGFAFAEGFIDGWTLRL